jgi:hypothetical protein
MPLYRHRVLNKLVVAAALTFPILVCAAPDENKLKYWLGTEKVVVKKGKLYDTKETISTDNISGFKKIDTKTNSKFNKRSTETVEYELEYMSEKLKKRLHCNGTITYSWDGKLQMNKEVTLESAVMNCH